MKTIKVKDGLGNDVLIPVLDVREDNREAVKKFVKLANGPISKYVPAKYGYGTNGQKKY